MLGRMCCNGLISTGTVLNMSGEMQDLMPSRLVLGWTSRLCAGDHCNPRYNSGDRWYCTASTAAAVDVARSEGLFCN